MRFEDIDRPRIIYGAQEQQLADMKALGLVPDVKIQQGLSHARHWRVFRAAIQDQKVYPCTCSRKEVQEALSGIASAPHQPTPLYSGHCRDLKIESLAVEKKVSVAWRFRSDVDKSGKNDFIVARTVELDTSIESFQPSYHWACAVDDHDGRYDLLVRAWDLADAAPQQRQIAAWLAANEGGVTRDIPIFHCALIVQENDERLEKRTVGINLDELANLGWPPARLLEAFERSLDTSLEVEPGEQHKRLKVSEILY